MARRAGEDRSRPIGHAQTMATATRQRRKPARRPAASGGRAADHFVVFGITGDLAKVMTFNSLCRLEARGLLDCPIVGVAFDDWSDVDLRHHVRKAVETSSGRKPDRKIFNRLAKRFSYVQGDVTLPEQINLDMEFAQQGGEGPTPYEVRLHAAMNGDSTRFTQQDNIEETWRVCGPLIQKPPRVHPYKPGSWGPKAADRLVAEFGGWHGT
jgi:glucose-6-phosphate 1-dehydrogenase